MSRKISWVASIDPQNEPAINQLENRLRQFYAHDADYYADIDFSAGNWKNEKELAYVKIKESCEKASAIGEFGCGAANILAALPSIASRYTGCDFSETLMRKNKSKYPDAAFHTIQTPNLLPFGDASFDLLFSVFVLEHTTRPQLILDECKRVLKKGGRLILFCPDFLGSGGLSSQQTGWSEGISSEKLKQGKWLDSAVTFFDNRVRIPLYCYRMRHEKDPAFLINTDPTVFYQRFKPDVDAVYVTHKKEIVTYLSPSFRQETNGAELAAYEKSKRLIYLSFIKQ